MSQLLYSLPLLACPVGMGLMMFFMMRGNKQESPRPSGTAADELTMLRAEVDQLRAAQRDGEHRPIDQSDSRRWSGSCLRASQQDRWH